MRALDGGGRVELVGTRNRTTTYSSALPPWLTDSAARTVGSSKSPNWCGIELERGSMWVGRLDNFLLYSLAQAIALGSLELGELNGGAVLMSWSSHGGGARAG
jgi:hypothetical protein